MQKYIFSLIVVLIWFTVSLVPVTAAEPPTAPILRIETGTHTAMIRRLATDINGRWLVSASNDKSLRVWDLSSGHLVRTIRPPIGFDDEGKLFSAAISPDGETIACGGWTRFNNGQRDSLSDEGFTIYLFNRASGNLIGRISGLPSEVMDLTFSPDGRFLAAALGGTNGVRLFQVTDWSLVGEDRNYKNPCTSADFSRDNRLVTASWDGYVRLYDVINGAVRLTTESFAYGDSTPDRAKFSPDGNKVAVNYSSYVSILSSRDLSLLFSPDTGDAGKYVGNIAWSGDGHNLFVGSDVGVGNEDTSKSAVIRRWTDGGRGSHIDTDPATTGIIDLAPLPDGRLAYSGSGAILGVIDKGGKRTLLAPPAIINFRLKQNDILVSSDGSKFSFGHVQVGKPATSFDLSTRTLTMGESLVSLFPPLTVVDGLKVTIDGSVTLNGTPLDSGGIGTTVLSFAISPDKNSFILGTDRFLWCFNREGNSLWRITAPGAAWKVNVTGNGTVAVAAFADGTIRWYRMSDGKELLAFFPHADRRRWVLWTPEGFFDHSPGGEELIGFHLNRGNDREAEFIPVSKLYNQFYRPDLVNASFEGKDISSFARAIDIKKILSPTTLPPKVRFITQSGSSSTPETEVVAELCDNGGGIGDITLFLNNMPITVESSGRGLKIEPKKQPRTCYTFSRILSLDNGINNISLMAYNRDNSIESERLGITISHASAFTGKPDLHILSVSVDKYRDGDLRLKYSNADAASVTELLQTRGKGIFGKITCHTLNDDNVTRDKLDALFTKIGKETRREDMFIMFVSGHGITYDKDGSFYFLPVNFRYTSAEDIPRQGISMDDFKKFLAKIQTSKSLLLLDTCNSGSFAEAIASRGVLEKTAINKLTRAVGRHTIVASSKSQVALEGYQGHGAFSWTLLEGMKGEAADKKGLITVNSLASFVESRLPDLTYKKWGYEQIPQKSLVGEDFAIGRK